MYMYCVDVTALWRTVEGASKEGRFSNLGRELWAACTVLKRIAKGAQTLNVHIDICCVILAINSAVRAQASAAHMGTAPALFCACAGTMTVDNKQGNTQRL